MKKIVFNWLIIVVLLLFMDLNVFSQDLKSAIKLTRSEQFSKADLIYKSILQKNPADGSIYFYYGENFLQKYFSDTLTYSFTEMSDSAGRQFKSGTLAEVDNPLNYVGLV